MEKLVKRKFGRVMINKILLRTERDFYEIQEMFKVFVPMTIILEVTYNFDDVIVYGGYSELFRELKEAEVIPKYVAWFKRDENDKVIFDRMEEVILSSELAAEKENSIKKEGQWKSWQCWIMGLIDFRYWFCDCHYKAPYGRVIMANCKKHD